MTAKTLEGSATLAPSTARAYAADLRHYSAWCAKIGTRALPARADALRLYFTQLLRDGFSFATIRRRAAAIAQAHAEQNQPNPFTPELRRLLGAIRRTKGAAPKAPARALTVDELAALVSELGTRRGPLAVRDRALLLLGFASGLRRSSLVALNREDLERQRGLYLVRIHREKNDQDGKGRVIGIHSARQRKLCPVRALDSYFRILPSGSTGPLFVAGSHDGNTLTTQRLAAAAVSAILQRTAEAADVDPRNLSAHSLRAGMITAAAAAGVPESLIMRQSGHRSAAVMHRYVRPGEAMRDNPMARVL